MMYPKPKIRKHKAKNNPKPTAEDRCIIHNTPYAETHEVFPGKHRQNSIKYGLQEKVCRKCHEYLTRNPKSLWAHQLRIKHQNRFVEQYGYDAWMRIFGFDYRYEEFEGENK